MVLPVSEAIAHVRSTLRMSKGAPDVGMFRILNDAGEYLLSMHQWAWAQGGQTKLAFEKDKDHVWLPRDFRDIIHIDVTQGLTTGFSFSTLEHLVQLRTSSITSSTWRHWGALTYVSRGRRATGSVVFTGVPADGSTITLDDGVNPPVTFEFDTNGDGVTSGNVEVDSSASGATSTTVAALLQTAIHDQLLGDASSGTGALELEAESSERTVTITNRVPGTQGNVTITSSGTVNATLSGLSGGADGGRPEPRIDLWPTPDADDPEALTVYYRRGWRHLDQDEHEVTIPDYLDTLYLQLVRAFARGYVREDVGSLHARLAEVEASPLMRAAIERDSSIQWDFGPLRHGAAALVATQVRQYPFNFTGTNGPA